MVINLTTKNKVGFVDCCIPRPNDEDLLYGVRTECNRMVISQILKSIYREIANSLLYIDTVFKIWNDLHERFHQSNVTQVFQIKKHLIALCQESLDVNTYYTCFKILWDELKDSRTSLRWYEAMDGVLAERMYHVVSNGVK